MKIALYIDGDNFSAAYAEELMKWVKGLDGDVVIRRVYGNSTAFEGTKAWKEPVRKYALDPVPQINTSGKKNIADLALILDAMEDAFLGRVDAICIASGDADYLKLVQRLRRMMPVYGCGEKEKTSEGYTNAFTKFKVFPASDTSTDDGKDSAPLNASCDAKPADNVPSGSAISTPMTPKTSKTPCSPPDLGDMTITPRKALIFAFEWARRCGGNCLKTYIGQTLSKLKMNVKGASEFKKNFLAKFLKLDNCQNVFTEKSLKGNVPLVLSPGIPKNIEEELGKELFAKLSP